MTDGRRTKRSSHAQQDDDQRRPRILTVLLLCQRTPTASCVLHKRSAPFDPSPLVALGDTVKYGSYVVYKIGDGIYKINDPGVTTGKGGAWGVDMYLILRDTRP